MTLALASAFCFALAASPSCRKDDNSTPSPNTAPHPSAGPAERTGERVGEKLDQAAVKTEKGLKTAASAVGSGLEKAGEKIKPKD
jgi:hypothetical protein